jgi:hypothetical protein
MKQFMALVLFPNGKEETLLLTVRNNGAKGNIVVEYLSNHFGFSSTMPKFLEWWNKMGIKEIERVQIPVNHKLREQMHSIL